MFNKKIVLSTASILTLLAPTAIEKIQAEENLEWQARSVEQIEQDILFNDSKAQYTIQPGDTISALAEALELSLEMLVELDALHGQTLIVPDVEFEVEYDENGQAMQLEVINIYDEKITYDVSGNIPIEIARESLGVVINTPVVEYVEEWIPEPEPAVYVEEPVVETFVESTVEPVEEWVEEPVEQWVDETVDYNVEAEPQVTETVHQVTIDEVQSPEVAVQAEVEVATTSEEVALESIEAVESAAETVAAEEIVPEAEVYQEASTEDVNYQTSAVEETTDVDTTYQEPTYEEVQETPEVETYEEVTPAEPNYVSDPFANPENQGLTYDAAHFKEEVASIYGETPYSLVRPGDPGDHGVGKAVDFMVYDDTELGNQIAQYSVDTMDENNISYVIWQQQIYGDWNRQWEMMEDRGSITQNHYDHVHVSFN